MKPDKEFLIDLNKLLKEEEDYISMDYRNKNLYIYVKTNELLNQLTNGFKDVKCRYSITVFCCKPNPMFDRPKRGRR